MLDSVLGGGLGSATGSTPSFGGGDPALKAYLPSADQYPPGFVPFGEFTYSLPDGVSQDGKLDVAASMAVSGDPAATTQGDFSKVGMLMTMVMHPDDLQALGDAFATIDDVDPATLEAEIRRGMEQAGVVGGMEVTNVRAYELDLGDGGFGMEMTFDIGGLFESLLGGTGLEGQAPPFEAISMRMYIFANGDYVGAVMRMAYADAVPDDGAELALARSIDSNLAAAP